MSRENRRISIEELKARLRDFHAQGMKRGEAQHRVRNNRNFQASLTTMHEYLDELWGKETQRNYDLTIDDLKVRLRKLHAQGVSRSAAKSSICAAWERREPRTTLDAYINELWGDEKERLPLTIDDLKQRIRDMHAEGMKRSEVARPVYTPWIRHASLEELHEYLDTLYGKETRKKR